MKNLSLIAALALQCQNIETVYAGDFVPINKNCVEKYISDSEKLSSELHEMEKTGMKMPLDIRKQFSDLGHIR